TGFGGNPSMELPRISRLATRPRRLQRRQRCGQKVRRHPTVRGDPVVRARGPLGVHARAAVRIDPRQFSSLSRLKRRCPSSIRAGSAAAALTTVVEGPPHLYLLGPIARMDSGPRPTSPIPTKVGHCVSPRPEAALFSLSALPEPLLPPPLLVPWER